MRPRLLCSRLSPGRITIERINGKQTLIGRMTEYFSNDRETEQYQWEWLLRRHNPSRDTRPVPFLTSQPWPARVRQGSALPPEPITAAALAQAHQRCDHS